MTALLDLSRPRYDDADVVVPAPAKGPGNWAGAASCVLVDGVFWLTYRVRRPLDEGRGVSVVVSRSSDGVQFEPVCEVFRDDFGAASFERPVIMPTGQWLAAVPELRHAATPSTGGSRPWMRRVRAICRTGGARWCFPAAAAGGSRIR